MEFGKVCPYCNNPVSSTDRSVVCDGCGTVYHEGCWMANNGCANPACPRHSQPVAQPAVQPMAQPVAQPYAQPAAQPYAQPVAQSYAQPAAQPYAQPVAQSYAQPVAQSYAQPAAQPSVCSNCGTPLAAGQAFCIKCGNKVDFAANNPVNASINQYNSIIEKTKPTKDFILFAVFALLETILLFVDGMFTSNVDAYTKYGSYATSLDLSISYSTLMQGSGSEGLTVLMIILLFVPVVIAFLRRKSQKKLLGVVNVLVNIFTSLFFIFSSLLVDYTAFNSSYINGTKYYYDRADQVPGGLFLLQILIMIVVFIIMCINVKKPILKSKSKKIG